MNPEQALDDCEVPQTTPRAERQRLVSKGKFLAEHCLDDGHTDCVLGFVEHCLGKSPAQLDVIMDLWGDLRQEYTRLQANAVVEDTQRLALLDELLQDLTSRLMHALRS
jgi:hypothetical protein